MAQTKKTTGGETGRQKEEKRIYLSQGGFVASHKNTIIPHCGLSRIVNGPRWNSGQGLETGGYIDHLYKKRRLWEEAVLNYITGEMDATPKIKFIH